MDVAFIGNSCTPYILGWAPWWIQQGAYFYAWSLAELLLIPQAIHQ